MSEARLPDEHFSRTELRYRIADAVNDRLKAIPFFHSSLKTAARWWQHRKDVRQVKAAVKQSRHSRPELNASAPADVTADLPLPPVEMRRLVGPFDAESFDNPSGKVVYPWIPEEKYRRFLDFGCGCGRVARQLILQKPRPELYVGVDLHPAMIHWCQENLTPAAPNFSFHHHDVFNVAFNPGRDKALTAPFPVADGEFTAVNALSVFTHLTEEQAGYYLRECARVLHREGVFQSSWFLFDKADHPMMDDSFNALYVSYADPSAAVIFDRGWLREMARSVGLRIYHVIPPGIRGFQWQLLMTFRTDVPEVDLPPDMAPRGTVNPHYRQQVCITE
jgi:SAM-dependent methyltransferase